MSLPATASLSRLCLRVKDVERMVAYYTGVIGLSEFERAGTRVTVAPADRLFHLDLVHAPEAALRPYPCPGLYHFALVVPDRPALGAIFRRLIDIGEPFEGMADHLVSEALYIRDPEGNGIELYRDRPRQQWVWIEPGVVKMVSDPIDAEGIISCADGPAPLHAATRFGHIHHHVRDLDETARCFEGGLGLKRTATLPGALFFAAGDYHHHVGSNTWAPDIPVPDDATGLVSYTWRLPEGDLPEAMIDTIGAQVLFER